MTDPDDAKFQFAWWRRMTLDQWRDGFHGGWSQGRPHSIGQENRRNRRRQRKAFDCLKRSSH